MTNTTKTAIATHQSTRIDKFFLMVCRIIFDIGFFYTLMPIFWILEMLIFNGNDLSSSILHSFMITMVLYHVIQKDQHKCRLLIGFMSIAIVNLGIALYTDNYRDLGSASMMSVIASFIAFLSFIMLNFIQKNGSKKQTKSEGHVCL